MNIENLEDIHNDGLSTTMQQITNRWVNMTFAGLIFAISITPCRCQNLRSHDCRVVSSTKDEMSYWRTPVMHQLD